MTCRYTLTVTAKCPVDEAVTDVYELVVEGSFLAVESILSAVAQFTDRPIYQEQLTEKISDWLGDDFTVTTTGTHSSVYTEVTA